jgi:hypothetical protein
MRKREKYYNYFTACQKVRSRHNMFQPNTKRAQLEFVIQYLSERGLSMSPGAEGVAREKRGVAFPDCWNWTNGDSRSTYNMGPSLVGSLGSLCRYKKFLSCHGGSAKPRTKYLLPHHTLFQFMCPHRPARWAGSRAGLPVSECESPVIPVRKLPVNITGSCALSPKPGGCWRTLFTKRGKGYKLRGRRGSQRD